MHAESLYDRAGGEAGVTTLVGIFYQRVLADPELSPFFAHIPMAKLLELAHTWLEADDITADTDGGGAGCEAG